jgi:putative DNA-invertase from lambdoid prophage Rac
MTKQPVRRAGLYARLSLAAGPSDLETQLQPLRAFAKARGWTAGEYTDTISGSKTSRPGLDRLLAACRKRQLDVLVIVKLDRLGRSLAHLVSVGQESWARLPNSSAT